MATKPHLESAACPKIVNDERIVLMGLLTEATARLHRELDVELEHSSGMPLGFFDVLVRIRRSPEGRLTMSEVANQTVYTSGGTTRLIDRIADAGYVQRANCPSDRRTTYVELTAKGLKALDAAMVAHLVHLETHLTSKLSETERSVLIAALTKLNGGSTSSARSEA